MSNAIKMCYNDVMRTLTVKLYNSDDFGYLSDMINIVGIIYNTALMTHEKCILPGSRQYVRDQRQCYDQ